MRGESAVHRPNTCGQADTDDNPGVCGHKSVAPAAAVESLRRDANHADAQAGVEECFVEVGALIGRHTSIFASFTIEDEVCGNEGTAYKRRAV